jgi:transposase
MLNLPLSVAIFVAASPVDLRRSFDGLAALVQTTMGLDPLGGALFLFFNSAHDRVKALFWDQSGYVILYKRLERGHFRLPRAVDPNVRSVTIEAAELELILRGVDVEPPKRRAAVRHDRARVLD